MTIITPTGIVGINSITSSGITTVAFYDSTGNLSYPQAFPIGTLMLFQQTAAPTGWTKQTTHDNKALRVVSGAASSGGTTAFTSVFASRTPAGTVTMTNAAFTLTTNEIPSHTHEFGGDDQVSGQGGYTSLGSFPYDATSNASGSGQRMRTLTDTIFGGASHTHTNTANFSGTALDFAVQYVDLIIAAKQ